MGKRPDYAVVVYCNLIRRTFKNIPILIGGLEASLRRLAHYDYWSDKLKRSILLDSQADLLLYGMGERAIVEAANALNDGMSVRDLTYIGRHGVPRGERRHARPVHPPAGLREPCERPEKIRRELLSAIHEYRPVLCQTAH